MTQAAAMFRRALVVDDSRAMRTILRRALEQRGFQVVEAEHGRDALEKLGRMRIPELALVDWNMPEMNGIDFIHELRGDKSYDAVRVLMVTTETEPSQMRRAMELGASEYLMKPFSPEALDDKLALLGFGP